MSSVEEGFIHLILFNTCLNPPSASVSFVGSPQVSLQTPTGCRQGLEKKGDKYVAVCDSFSSKDDCLLNIL